MLEIIIEEVAINPVIQAEEVISTVTVQITEMQTPGPIGPPGTAGVDGVTGADGKSAYQSALDGGFVGTELEFNTFLSKVDKLDNLSGINTGDETALTIINKIGDGSKINQSYLPSYVDDILEYDTVALFPLDGELGKIYIVTTGVDINKQYRWTGSLYAQITNGLIASTNDVSEGVNGLYFTENRVLSTLLTGISFITGGIISATDSILVALGKLQKQISDNLVLIGLKQNILTNPLTGQGSGLDPTTYALQDGTILYHSVKWFTPTSTVSTVGTTITSVGTQFTSAMVGAKLIINGEWRIITAYTSSTVVTVASTYSQNYIGVVAGSWGVYSRFIRTSFEVTANYNTSEVYGFQGIKAFVIDGNTFSADVLRGSSNNVNYNTNQAIFGGGRQIIWSNSTSGANESGGAKDLGLRRNAAGILEIYDGVTSTGLEANRRDLLTRKITASQIQINSTTQGFLPPRMTNAQRVAIVSPAIGLVVYCTDATEGLYVNKSTGWTLLL